MWFDETLIVFDGTGISLIHHYFIMSLVIESSPFTSISDKSLHCMWSYSCKCFHPILMNSPVNSFLSQLRKYSLGQTQLVKFDISKSQEGHVNKFLPGMNVKFSTLSDCLTRTIALLYSGVGLLVSSMHWYCVFCCKEHNHHTNCLYLRPSNNLSTHQSVVYRKPVKKLRPK